MPSAESSCSPIAKSTIEKGTTELTERDEPRERTTLINQTEQSGELEMTNTASTDAATMQADIAAPPAVTKNADKSSY